MMKINCQKDSRRRNNLKKIFGNILGGRAALGLLIIRVIVGAALMFHGWGKIQKPFSWMPPEAPIPGFLQALAALSEFGGGLALIIGLLTPLAAFGIACTMAFATFGHHMRQGDPFVATSGGPSYELAAVYLGAALLMILAGPGKISLDALLFGRKDQTLSESYR
jgi:putative oxidoreductase